MDKDDVGHIYRGVLLSHREGTNAICSNMAETVILNEVRKKEKDKYQVLSFICGS